MRFSVKIISVILIISIIFSCMTVCVFGSGSEDYHSSICSLWDVIMTSISESADLASDASILPLNAMLWNIVGTAADSLSSNRCPVSDDGLHHGHIITPVTSGFTEWGRCVLCSCDYCSNNFWCYSSDLSNAYNDWVASLPSELEVSSSGITAYGSGVEFCGSATSSTAESYWAERSLFSLCSSAPYGSFLLTGQGSGGSFYGLLKVYSTVYNCPALVKAAYSSLSPYTTVNVPVGEFYYSDSFSTTSSFSACYSSNFGVTSIFLSFDDALAAYSINSSVKHYFLTSDSYLNNYYRGGQSSSHYMFSWSNVGYIDTDGTVYTGKSASVTMCNHGGFYYSHYYYPALPLICDVSSEYEDTRFNYLTHSINEYNTTNNYIDDSTAVNIYLTDESNDGDTINLYNINLYDEETMVFTEPVSGQQYQSTGWTYDYNDCSYDITLESGTFTINDTDITEVIVTYMDEYAAITYLDSSGNAVHTVKYAYVAVSQSDCALYGHTNTVETTKEPTCIGTGERKYTCSVCGNEEIEVIPELGHIWKYSVLYEPENGNNGMGIYECETCGSQYTEVIYAGGDGYVDLDPDEETENDNDYIIKFEDDEGNEQETSIKNILAKFNFLYDIYDIGDTMLSLVSADAAAAYSDDGTSSGAPSITINLAAAESNYGYQYGGEVEVLDLSWYAPYKERVDSIVSGFLWLLFLWGLFKAAPSILGSVGITSNRLEDYSSGHKGGRNK